MALVLAGLRKRFEDVVALDGVGFTVEPGQVFGSWGRTAQARRQRCASS
jgi:ABC-type uncharacterized transport system ATPase subunit